MRINCMHFDHSISLEEMCTVVVVENPSVLGKIIYSLTEDTDEYFSIYSEEFKQIPRKNIISILHPLMFDFDERKMKSVLTNYILRSVNDDVEFKEKIEREFLSLANELEKFINENSNIEFISPVSFEMKDIIKAFGININSQDAINTHEKIMLILNVLNEVTVDNLVIFVNLSMLISQEEYCSVVEMINLHSLRVLLLEGSKQFLKDVDYYHMDYDFCLSKVNKNML